jgi:hypothetical protein
MAREIVTSENRAKFIEKKLAEKAGKKPQNLAKDIHKGLQESNKSTFPKIPVGNVFKNPYGRLPDSKVNLSDKAIESEKDLPFAEIALESIVPTQRNINFDNLKKVKDIKDAKDSIIAVEHEGKYYLVDGHHRVANDILRNLDKVKARIYKQ